jgi:hypothetical protein
MDFSWNVSGDIKESLTALHVKWATFEWREEKGGEMDISRYDYLFASESNTIASVT